MSPIQNFRRSVRRGYFRFLRLLFYSGESKHKITLGAAYGVFWGLTPTVGLQSSILIVKFTLGLFLSKITKGKFKYLEFNFPLALALTWISNPFDAPFLYFLFYYVGALVMPEYSPLGFNEFITLLAPLLKVEGLLSSLSHMSVYFENLLEMVKNLGVQVVYPLIIGSLILAIPSAIATYFIAMRLIHRFEEKKKKQKKGSLRVLSHT